MILHKVLLHCTDQNAFAKGLAKTHTTKIIEVSKQEKSSHAIYKACTDGSNYMQT